MSFAIPRDYSMIAPVYDQVFNRFLCDGHKRLGAMLKKEKPSKDFKILEVGVGSGLTLSYLPANVQYSGIDINEKMLELAHEKAKLLKKKNIDLSVMDAHKLTYKAGSFDLVLGASVITAVEDPQSVMKEMIRVTKKGGRIAIIANIRNNSYRSQIVRRFDPLTKKFLGFRTDMDANYFGNFKGLKLLQKEPVNSVMGFHLSSFLLFEKR